MTTVVAWERHVGAVSELVMASDSRLSGGEDWDACAKIFDVGRDDALLAFAGATDRALPLVFQAISTTRSYRGSALRTLDLPKYAGHLNRVLNAVLGEARGPAASAAPNCKFLLAGWSWSLGKFRIYRYTYNHRQKKFWCNAVDGFPRSIKGDERGTIYTAIGDGASRMTGAIAKSYNSGEHSGPLDYLPLEKLHLQAEDLAERSVGGSIQVSKVYKSIRVEHFATRIHDKLYVSGRPVLRGENIDLRAIVRSADGKWQAETPNRAGKDSLGELDDLEDEIMQAD